MQSICITYGEGATALYKFVNDLKSKLTLYLTLCVLFSAAVGSVSGYLIYVVGSNYVDRVSDDPQKNRELQLKYLDEIQTYISSEQIFPGNISKLSQWTNKNENVYVSVYQNRRIIFNSDNEYYTNTDGEQEEVDLQEEMESAYSDYLYRLVMSDGTTARVDIFCYDYLKYDNYFLLVSIACGILLFVFVLTRLIRKKIDYINKIVDELEILEGGNLEYAITIQGNDELSNLAQGIDQMRLSILDNKEKEQEMLQKNKDLVTSMSHDLRTPLTTLTGYLELLNMRENLDENRRRKYLELSLTKTREIKQLSDDLFSYFLIYGKDENVIDSEPVLAYSLAEDLIQNQFLEIEEECFVIEGENRMSPDDGNCLINVQYMQRVLNNIISNLRKYADPQQVVSIQIYSENKNMIILVDNAVSQSVEPHESTKIGMITCERIMRLHGGGFETNEENNRFTTKIIIPMEDAIC